MRNLSRREMLRLGLGGAAAAFLAACAEKSGGTLLRTPQDSGAETSLPAGPPTVTPPPPTSLPPTSPNQPGPTALGFEYPSDVSITSIEDFYTYTYHPQPSPTIPDFQLRIFGYVRQELRLTLDDLQAMSVIEEMRTLECISNPVGGKLISNAVWRGVPMVELLDRTGVLPRAIELKFECADGYHTSIPVDLARDPHSFLAYWMNGEPLPPQHGYPLRALWPGRYGQKQPKWITGIELIAEPHLGHWEQQGWSNEAIIVPNSRIDHPQKRDVVILPTTISGIAFANRSGVARVDVSVDDGITWHEAELVHGPSPLVWTEWRFEWREGDPGSSVIRARVTDGAGRRQRRGNNRLLGGIKPNGTDAQHAVAVTVKRG